MPSCECGCGRKTSGPDKRFVVGHAARVHHAARIQKILEAGEKECPKCKVVKSLDEFPISKAHASGYYTYCKLCKSKLMREANARWKKRHPEKAKRKERESNLKKNYGITIEQYEELLANQGGQCLICKTEPGDLELAVDHCHQTNEIRGLLCRGCNHGIGNFNDDPELLRSALRYLRRKGTGIISQPSPSRSTV